MIKTSDLCPPLTFFASLTFLARSFYKNLRRNKNFATLLGVIMGCLTRAELKRLESK